MLGSNLVVEFVIDLGSTKKCCLEITHKSHRAISISSQ